MRWPGFSMWRLARSRLRDDLPVYAVQRTSSGQWLVRAPVDDPLSGDEQGPRSVKPEQDARSDRKVRD
jgi:hypothetical protein